jgi:predicted extracellular nuclease
VLLAFGCRDSGSTSSGQEGADASAGTGTGMSVRAIQEGRVAVGDPVALAGVVVTAVDRYGSRTGSVYVADPEGGPYSGVMVFNPTIEGGIDQLAVGDVVSVSGGVVDEFALESDQSGRTLTEISAPRGGTVTVVKTGTGTVPEPVLVDPVAWAASDDEAEQWEGVLIRFEQVAAVRAPRQVSERDPSLVEMTVTGPVAVSSGLTSLEGVRRGACFASMVGIGDYFFDYKLLPRSAEDLVGGDGCATEDTADLCDNGVDDDRDGFVDCDDLDCGSAATCVSSTTLADIRSGAVSSGQVVAVTDLVVTAVSPRLKLVWVQQLGASEGIAVYRPTVDDGARRLEDVAVGERVDVRGTVTEFHGLTELTRASLVGRGAAAEAPLPAYIDDPAQLVDAAAAEAYESVLVELQRVQVRTTPDRHGEWTVGSAEAEVRVDDAIYAPAPAPAVGTCAVRLVGVLHYAFNSFRILPRSPEDLELAPDCGENSP